jgi:polysaccharide export outer membrane protein
MNIARKRLRLFGTCSELRGYVLKKTLRTFNGLMGSWAHGPISPSAHQFINHLVSCVLHFPYIAFLLTFHLWVSSTVAAAADETGSRPIYIINPGDQLLITVAGHEKELTAPVVVRPDGMVTYPLVGDVKAAGLTTVQLSSAIGEQLSALGYYEDPQVTVQLRVSSQEIIYVFGDVKDPGEKRSPEPINVVEALAAAGGFEETADLANAKIIKKRKEVVPVDLMRLLKRRIVDQGVVSDELLSDRLMLEDGDVLIIPSAIEEERVNILGHVHNPGQYPVKSTVSLVEALAFAGGYLETTADLRHIRIIKPDSSIVIVDATRAWADEEEGSEYSLTSSFVPSPTPLVEPGDSVVVPERGKVNILGSVKNQGQFAVDGEISIIDALALAGVEKDANLEKLRIIRKTGEQLTLDASKIWRQQNIEEKLGPGDTLIVPRAFRVNWSAVSAVVMIISTLYAIFR